MGRPLSFIRLSVDGQLEYFHLAATVNSAAVNTGVQASVSRSQDQHLAAARRVAWRPVYLAEEVPGCFPQRMPFYVPTGTTQKFQLHILGRVHVPSLRKNDSHPSCASDPGRDVCVSLVTKGTAHPSPAS